MRNPERIPVIMNKIQKLWEQYPDMRFFQIVEMIKSRTPKIGYCSEDPFYLEDGDLELILELELSF